jgi:acyl carrier protein
MVSSEQALKWVYGAADAANRDLADEDKIAKSPDVRLRGEGSGVDSLTIINLLIELEAIVEQKTGKRLSLMSVEAADMEKSFATARSLADYVAEQVNKG